MVRNREDAAVVTAVNQDIETKQIPTLGYLVWWSLEGVEIPKATAESLVATLGIGKAKDLCPQIEARGALKKALDSLDTTYFQRRILDDDERVAMALVSESVVDTAGQLGVDWQAEQVVTYVRATKSIDLTTAYMATEIRTAFHKYGETYRANEVRRVIQNILALANAITVRESGGVYFSPEANKPILDALKTFAGSIPGVHLVMLGIVDTASAKQEMAGAAGAEIQRDLAACLKDIVQLQTRKQDGTKIRGATLQQRLTDFKALQLKAECYRDLVNLDIQNIESTLRNLEDTVRSLF